MKHISSLAIGVTIAFSAVSADQKPSSLTDKAHPSISAQVRLSSWWIARHAENIASVAFLAVGGVVVRIYVPEPRLRGSIKRDRI